MSFSPDAIANRFLDLAWEPHGKSGHDVSPMKIQKLVFFAHGWYLALVDAGLINEPIQAWRWGPVIHSLYREFKSFGDTPIDEHAKELSVKYDDEKRVFSWNEPTIESECELDSKLNRDAATAIVERVWEVYGGLTPAQLSNMTHEEGEPWRIIRDQFEGEIPRGVKIPDSLIKERFIAKLRKN